MYCVSRRFFEPLQQWALSEHVTSPLLQYPPLRDSYNQAEIEAMWNQLLEAKADPLLGYHAARLLQPRSWPGLSEQLLRADSFQRGYQVLLAAQPHLAQPNFLTLEEGDDFISLVVDWPGFSPLVTRHLTDYTVRCLALMASWLRQPYQWIHTLDLAHAGVSGQAERDYPFLRCCVGQAGRIRFNAGRTVIVIQREVYQASLRSISEASTAVHLRPSRAAAGVSEDWVQKVTLAIEHGLRSGNLSRRLVAQSLCVSERTMQRGLEPFGTSYAELLQAVRLRYARRLLEETDVAVADIAMGAGFRDPTNFFRLFKREVGMTPAQYRGHYRAKHRLSL